MCCRLSCLPIYRKVTHVIFDVDGTLLDTEKFYSQVLQEICASEGKDYTPEVRRAHVGTPTEITCQIVKDKLQLELPLEEFIQTYNSKARDLISQAEILPGAAKLVQHFFENNVQIALATSSMEEDFKIKFSKHQDFFKLFTHYVLTTDPEVAKGKPSPDIYLTAAQRFEDKPSPQDCLVFEDTSTGVKAAKAAGMQCVLVPSSDLPLALAKEATLVLNSLEEFKPEIFGLPSMDAKPTSQEKLQE